MNNSQGDDLLFVPNNGLVAIIPNGLITDPSATFSMCKLLNMQYNVVVTIKLTLGFAKREVIFTGNKDDCNELLKAIHQWRCDSNKSRPGNISLDKS